MNKMDSINANKRIKVERKKSSQPLVTIVTVTYNLIEQGRRDWFIQNLESVRSQTYPNIEHIVIDGASTDGTLEILEEYQNKGWIKYYSEPDAGIYDAMNKGILKAKGEYISFLNSDDLYHRIEGVQKIVEKLERSKADYCYSICRFIKENGDFAAFLQDALGCWFVKMPFSHQTLFVKVELMRQLGGFDVSFKSDGDYDFVIRMILSGARGEKVPYEFVSFRLGGLSSRQREQSDKECIKSFIKNYTPLFSGLNCRQFFYQRKVPYKLFRILQSRVSAETRNLMQLSWDIDSKKERILGYKIFPAQTNVAQIIPKKIYRLFCFLPILKVKRSTNKTNIRLFCFIPFLKIQKRSENDTRVYLFGFIPVLRLKKTNRHEYANLFNVIPLWKVNR